MRHVHVSRAITTTTIRSTSRGEAEGGRRPTRTPKGRPHPQDPRAAPVPPLATLRHCATARRGRPEAYPNRAAPTPDK